MISRYLSGSSDTIEYDASDNVNKVIETLYVQGYDPNGSETFTLYDFTSRDNKGDQLYNLNQVLHHGIANLNVDEAGVDEGLFYAEYIFQFTKYPALSTNINRPYATGYCIGCGTYPVKSTSTPMYDSQNRLTSYTVFFNDFPLSYLKYHITYYK